jgi:large subunit ribosomal protein L35
MPKLKSVSGAKKRFKLTASGKLKRKKAFKRHILTKKDQKRKRGLRKSTVVHEADESNIKRLLPYLN